MEINQKEAAALLGISTRQFRNLRDQGLFEFIKGSKKYNAAAVVQEYIAFKIKKETGRGQSINLEAEKAEHERYKKEMSKLKLRKMRKEVHLAADVEAFLSEMLVNFRGHLLSIPGKVAPLILGETDINIIIESLTAQMLEALDELAEYDPDAINGDDENYFDVDEDDDEADEETSEE